MSREVAASGERVAQLVRVIERLEDVPAILALKQTYARLCDQGYPAQAIADLFTTDGECDWGGGEFATVRGQDQIREYFATCPTQYLWTMHYVVNVTLTVSPEGDRAHGLWYLLKPCTVADDAAGGRRAVWMAGVYDDEFTRVDGVWRIRRLSARMAFTTPYESGWLREPFVESTKAPNRWRSTDPAAVDWSRL